MKTSDSRFPVRFARLLARVAAAAISTPASRNMSASMSRPRITTIDERWELALIGKNLTNCFYVTGDVDGFTMANGSGTPAGIGADQLGFGNIPRTLQI